MRSRADVLFTLLMALTIAAPSVSANPSAVVATSQAGRAVDRGGPMRVVLMVDTSDGVGAAVPQIRAAVAAFADALPPEHELMLVTTGRRVEVRVQPTTDHKKIKDSARGLLSDHGPTPLIDAMIEIDNRFMRKVETRWPALVIITGDGSESSVSTDDKAFNAWLSTLPNRRISIDAVLLRYNGNSLTEAAAAAATRATGGHMDATTVAGSLPERMKAIAERLSAEHPAPQ